MALGFKKASPAYILKVFRLLHEDIVAKPPPLIIDATEYVVDVNTWLFLQEFAVETQE